MRVAIRDLKVGDDVIVITWLHQADREKLEVHPRFDTSRPLTGVFTTVIDVKPVLRPVEER